MNEIVINGKRKFWSLKLSLAHEKVDSEKITLKKSAPRIAPCVEGARGDGWTDAQMDSAEQESGAVWGDAAGWRC